MLAGLWRVGMSCNPKAVRAAAKNALRALAPKARIRAGRWRAVVRRQTVIARRLQHPRERHGRNALPYWVPSRMGPRRSRDPSPCPYASAIRHAAIILSALSMPSDRPNRCSALRSQLALGSYSRSSLPALLLPAPEQGRFPGRPMAARLLIGNAWSVGAGSPPGWSRRKHPNRGTVGQPKKVDHAIENAMANRRASPGLAARGTAAGTSRKRAGRRRLLQGQRLPGA